MDGRNHTRKTRKHKKTRTNTEIANAPDEADAYLGPNRQRILAHNLLRPPPARVLRKTEVAAKEEGAVARGVGCVLQHFYRLKSTEPAKERPMKLLKMGTEIVVVDRTRLGGDGRAYCVFHIKWPLFEGFFSKNRL